MHERSAFNDFAPPSPSSGPPALVLAFPRSAGRSDRVGGVGPEPEPRVLAGEAALATPSPSTCSDPNVPRAYGSGGAAGMVEGYGEVD